MFSYLLSVGVVFLFFGTLNNILLNMDLDWYLSKHDSGEKQFSWILVSGASVAWGVAVPLLFLFFIMFLLKLLTDKISAYIINHIKDR